MNNSNLYRCGLAVVGCALSSFTGPGALADVNRFDGLGSVPGGLSTAVALSSDGTVVAGNLGSPTLGGQGFRWTRDTGTVRIGAFGSSQAQTTVLGMSGDGSTLVGVAAVAPNGQAFRWTEAYGLQPIPGTAAYAASMDGSVIVGETQLAGGSSAAYRWTALTGLVELGNLSGEDGHSGARCTSADGLTIAGYSDPFFPVVGHIEAFSWTPASLMLGLGWLSGGGTLSIANAVSADGTVVVGESDSSAGRQAFRATLADGMQSLGTVSGGSAGTRALAVSADGSVIVGTENDGGTTQAFIWTPEAGMRSLRTALMLDRGLDLSGWTLTDARGISADGRTIVGNGISPCGRAQPWIAHLGTAPPCTADFNGDGQTSTQDIFAFLDAWFAGAGTADINHVNCVDTQDIFDFLALWFVGCP